MVLEWQAKGTTIEQAVPTRKEAEAWVAAWRPEEQGTKGGTIVGATPNSAQTGPHSTAGAPSGGTDNHPTTPAYVPLPMGSNISPQDYATNPVMAMIRSASNFAVGPDPSTGTAAIFGMDPADTNRMDGLLLPPTLQDGEARQEFYELAMDVASLPGGYRFSDAFSGTSRRTSTCRL